MEFIDALEKATAADLAELDQKIAEHERVLASLKTARSILDVRLNGPKPKNARPTRPARDRREDDDTELEANLPDSEPAVVSIMKFLESTGPSTVNVISRQLKLSEAMVDEIITRHTPCFATRRVGNRYGYATKVSLTEVGKKSLAEDREMANGR